MKCPIIKAFLRIPYWSPGCVRIGGRSAGRAGPAAAEPEHVDGPGTGCRISGFGRRQVGNTFAAGPRWVCGRRAICGCHARAGAGARLVRHARVRSDVGWFCFSISNTPASQGWVSRIAGRTRSAVIFGTRRSRFACAVHTHGSYCSRAVKNACPRRAIVSVCGEKRLMSVIVSGRNFTEGNTSLLITSRIGNGKHTVGL